MAGNLLSKLKAVKACFFPSIRERNPFLKGLDNFRNNVDGILRNYRESDYLKEIDPGSINIPLEEMITNYRGLVSRMQSEYTRLVQAPKNATENTRRLYQDSVELYGQVCSDAQKLAYDHLAFNLASIGEGYSLLQKIGSQNPLKDLGVAPLDYINNKVEKIEALVRKNIKHSHAIGYHFSEIFVVANHYGVEISAIRGMREVVRAYLQDFVDNVRSESNVKKFIQEMQKQAANGKLNPYDSIEFKDK